jgi:TonB family protein
VRQEKNPVFLLKTGFFIGIRMKMGNSPLKVAASVSLGIHFLFFGIASGLLQESKILQNPIHYVKVTLLPLVNEEKPDAKIIPPVPLKVGNHDRQEGEEPVLDLKGINREPLLPPNTMAKKSSPEEPTPILKNKEEEKISNDPIHITTPPGSVSDTDSNAESEGNMASSREATSMEGDLSVSLPSFHFGESYGNVFSYHSSGRGAGSGTGPGNGGSGNGGSGKGTGVFGKFFYAHKGGNGVWPRYAENPKPAYPQEAREKGYEGEVVLRVEVLSNGRVGQIEVRKSSGFELLDHSALTTVKQWRFIPAKKGDIAIPLWVNIPIKFQLQ